MPTDDQALLSTLPHSGAALQRPFLWAKSIYALSYRGGHIQTIRFALNASLQATGYTNLGETAVTGCWNLLATCVYRGQPYLFFDRETADDRWWHHISYKITSNPDTGWAPVSGEGISTGLRGQYAKPGAFGPMVPALAAKELGDKLYLFYWQELSIRWAVYDGSAWKTVGKLFEPRYHANFAVCNAMIGDEPVLVFAGREFADDRYLTLSIIDIHQAVRTHHHVLLDWVDKNAPFGLVHGTIENGLQSNVVQVFGNNGGLTNPNLRRITVGLDSPPSAAGWADTSIRSKTSEWAFCDAVPTAMPTDKTPDFRRHHVILTKFDDMWTHDQIVSVYKSDYFRCENPDSKAVNTGGMETEEPDAWTLIGVVEGTPPFSRNGAKDRNGTSFVDYGLSSTEKVVISQTWETSVNAGVTAGDKDAGTVSFELSATFASTNDMTKTEKMALEQTLKNEVDNHDGSYGWQIVAKPELLGRRYTRLTHDGKVALGTYLVLQVTGAAIIPIEYRLDQPPKGMQVRRPTSDVRAWTNVDLPTYPDTVDLRKMSSLVASTRGAEGKVSLELIEGRERTTKGSAKVTVKKNANLSKLFKLDSAVSVSFTHTTKVTSEFTQKIQARLKLSRPTLDVDPAEIVQSITISPYWYIPKPEARLDPEKRPFWVADQSRGNGLIPWCLTWVVTDVKIVPDE